MKRIYKIILILALFTICSNSSADDNPVNRKVGIIAHRGFWNCEQGGYAQNSIAALKAAQDAEFWGSEFDVQITSDSVVISNHDKEYGPHKWIIAEHRYNELCKYPLPNGETLPTLEDYLEQGKKCSTTMLVLEIKKQKNREKTLFLTDRTMEIIKRCGLYDPSRIMFISFSKDACLHIVRNYPGFKVQFLTGTMSADKLKKEGLDGADYHYLLYNKAKIKRLHKQLLNANVWTVDNPKKMLKYVEMGVDYITTNEPLEARHILGDREL